jgi:hypothetical protein
MHALILQSSELEIWGKRELLYVSTRAKHTETFTMETQMDKQQQSLIVVIVLCVHNRPVDRTQ